MRRYIQWATIFTLAFALAVLLAPGGIAHNDDDDDGDESEDCEDQGGGGAAGGAEMVIGSFFCPAFEDDLSFSGTPGVGSISVGLPVADEQCVTLAQTLQTSAESAGCFLGPFTTEDQFGDLAVRMKFVCAGPRDEVIGTMASLTAEAFNFAPPPHAAAGPIQKPMLQPR